VIRQLPYIYKTTNIIRLKKKDFYSNEKGDTHSTQLSFLSLNLSLQATVQSNPSATKVALSLPFFNSTWLDLSALFVPLFIGSL